MFQRLRDAIDSRIAEEQARQKAAQDNISRANSARRPPASSSSPHSRPRRNTGTPVRGPDPKEFEAAFTIGDDEHSSRPETPRPGTPGAASEAGTSGEGAEMEGKATGATEQEAPEKEPKGKEAPTELPPDVRAKLRRLDKLESRYHELLKAYRMAHSRVLSIEPFEAALRENTPLTSISEPKAFTEYLNQSTQKSDMVMEELKRVTTECEGFKNKFEEVEKAHRKLLGEATDVKEKQPTTGSKKGTDATDETETSEEFFSFDNEAPRLERELKEKQAEVDGLNHEVEKLKRDMSVTRESTEGMVHNLETATRELVELRETKEKLCSDIENLQTSNDAEINDLKAKLACAESSLESTGSEVKKLESQLMSKCDEIKNLQKETSENIEPSSNLVAQIKTLSEEKSSNEEKLASLNSLVEELKTQLNDAMSTISSLQAKPEESELSAKNKDILEFVDKSLGNNSAWISTREKIMAGEPADFNDIIKSLAPTKEEVMPAVTTPSPIQDKPAQGTVAAASGTGKKKNKKKKKGGKAEDQFNNTPAPVNQPAQESSALITKELDGLKEKIKDLTEQLSKKEDTIARLSSKLKVEGDLKEEIETLRQNLVELGQEHVEAKKQIKELLAEKSTLEGTARKLEEDLAELRTSNASTSADSEKMHSALREEVRNLQIRSETDLSAANQLATTRFKDLTNLRETLEKIQPELRKLRSESAELKTLRETVSSTNSEIKILSSKNVELHAELVSVKSERGSELENLNKKIRQATDSRLKAEENLTITQSNLRSAESKRQDAINARDKTTHDLSKAQEGLKNTRIKMQELKEQISQQDEKLSSLQEEVKLKTTQHSNAQSLMNSMRNQTKEIATQMKEASERCDSLDEELAEAHRLLNERTREGETMRRLLNDIESRSDSKVRDFKERMEAAIEERDRAEDEASTNSRRHSREMEELKAKVREAEKAVRAAAEDQEDLENSQKDWRRRRDELEAALEESSNEVDEIRQAMTGLRDTLNESEERVHKLQEEKAELCRSVEDTNSRLEKLRRSHKTLGEDVRLRGSLSGRQSSRSSIDSGSRRAVASPGRSETPVGPPSNASIDYMYLKNVLLQFLEQRDKNYQKQLIPVLGMLLHFDRTDEQKWMSAIMSK